MYEILKKREKEIQRKDNRRGETKTVAYVVTKPNKRRCYACGKLGHIAKKCWYRGKDREIHKMEPNHYKKKQMKKFRNHKDGGRRARKIGE